MISGLGFDAGAAAFDVAPGRRLGALGANFLPDLSRRKKKKNYKALSIRMRGGGDSLIAELVKDFILVQEINFQSHRCGSKELKPRLKPRVCGICLCRELFVDRMQLADNDDFCEAAEKTDLPSGLNHVTRR